ncbi:exportin-2 [Tanacetum coccineum]
MDPCSLKDIFLKILSQDADERLQGETAFSNKTNNHQFALSILRMTKETTIDDIIKLCAANKFKELVTSRWESSLNPILKSEKKVTEFRLDSWHDNLLAYRDLCVEEFGGSLFKTVEQLSLYPNYEVASSRKSRSLAKELVTGSDICLFGKSLANRLLSVSLL